MAFTLLEVIIACAIFFMFAFAVLELVTRGLSAARSIQQREPDIGALLCNVWTNRVLQVGSASGDFEELYPGVYPGYHWDVEVEELPVDPFPTNMLKVTVVITGTTGKRKTSETVGIAYMYSAQPPGGFKRLGGR